MFVADTNFADTIGCPRSHLLNYRASHYIPIGSIKCKVITGRVANIIPQKAIVEAKHFGIIVSITVQKIQISNQEVTCSSGGADGFCALGR